MLPSKDDLEVKKGPENLPREFTTDGKESDSGLRLYLV